MSREMIKIHTIPPNARFEDFTGRQFGELKVVGFGGKDHRNHATWICQCSCGTKRRILGTSLRTGRSRHCPKCRHLQHGHARRSFPSMEYKVWRSMRARCRDAEKYPNYAGRGLSVDPRWDKFGNFLVDMGTRPGEEFSIERIDNEKGYGPGNCRWATRLEQSNNRRTNRNITHDGKTQTLTKWAKDIGIHSSSLGRRLDNGWPLAKALKKPASTGNQYQPRKRRACNEHREAENSLLRGKKG